MISLLDTNVVIRFLTGEKSPKYKSLPIFFEKLEQGTLHTELKLIVLFQVIFVLKSYYQVPKSDIAAGLLMLLDFSGIVTKEKKVVRKTLELWRDHNLEIVDCYLIANLEGDSQNLLYSYDRDFDKFGIQRIEP